MYNVELFNRTTGQVIANKQCKTDVEASKAAKTYIEQVKRDYKVVKMSTYGISARGFIFEQTLYTETEEFRISTAKM